MIRYRGHAYQDVGFTPTGRWGNQGSGMLFTTGEKILLLERSGSVEEPHTWGLPGGACRTVNIYFTGYGIGVVSCDCGIEVSVPLDSWAALQQAAVRWNEKLAGLTGDESE